MIEYFELWRFYECQKKNSVYMNHFFAENPLLRLKNSKKAANWIKVVRCDWFCCSNVNWYAKYLALSTYIHLFQLYSGVNCLTVEILLDFCGKVCEKIQQELLIILTQYIFNQQTKKSSIPMNRCLNQWFGAVYQYQNWHEK